MAILPILSDALRRRFEREERRHANMRRVFGYRRSDGSLCDNLIIHTYADLSVCKSYFEHVFSLCELRWDSADVDFVYLGVWYKDKRKFDFVDVPELVFRLCDVMKRDNFTETKKKGEKK